MVFTNHNLTQLNNTSLVTSALNLNIYVQQYWSFFVITQIGERWKRVKLNLKGTKQNLGMDDFNINKT